MSHFLGQIGHKHTRPFLSHRQRSHEIPKGSKQHFQKTWIRLHHHSPSMITFQNICLLPLSFIVVHFKTWAQARPWILQACGLRWSTTAVVASLLDKILAMPFSSSINSRNLKWNLTAQERSMWASSLAILARNALFSWSSSTIRSPLGSRFTTALGHEKISRSRAMSEVNPGPRTLFSIFFARSAKRRLDKVSSALILAGDTLQIIT